MSKKNKIAGAAELTSADLMDDTGILRGDYNPVDGTHRKGENCGVCGGAGKMFCCQSFAYALGEAFENDGTDMVTWSNALPRFPGSNMEMSYCPFCGRKFSKLPSVQHPPR